MQFLKKCILQFLEVTYGQLKKVHLKKVADSLPLFCISKRIATGNFPAWQVEIDAMTRAEYKCQFGKMASVAATVKIEFKLKVIKLLAKMASIAATVKF